MDVRQIGLKWTEMEQSKRKWRIGTFYQRGRVVKAGHSFRAKLFRLEFSFCGMIYDENFARVRNFCNHPAAINANLLQREESFDIESLKHPRYHILNLEKNLA